MKRLTYYTLSSVFLLLISFFKSIAQDTTSVKTDITQTLTNDDAMWYMQPWVWIVGGVALLLLLIALFSGGKKKNDATSRTDKVIITKTVRTETDVDD
ncbi:MAG: hypothetical protein ABIT96_00385 [Ferruginibacter sp.]